jgi:acyl-CoA hydrolase
VERLDGSRELINRAYLVFVALDDEDRPVQVPAFIPETTEEKQEYAAAEERRRIRLQR